MTLYSLHSVVQHVLLLESFTALCYHSLPCATEDVVTTLNDCCSVAYEIGIQGRLADEDP